MFRRYRLYDKIAIFSVIYVGALNVAFMATVSDDVAEKIWIEEKTNKAFVHL